MLVLFFFLDCKRPSIRRWKLKTMLDQLQVLQILTPVLTMIVITGYHVSNSMLNSGKLRAILALHRGVSWWKAPCTKCTKEFGFPGWTFWKKSLRCDMCHYSPRMPTTRWNVWSLSQLCNRGAALEASFDDARREAVCIYIYSILMNAWQMVMTSLLAGGSGCVLRRLCLQVEHQTRRRYMAEHALAMARTEIGDCKGLQGKVYQVYCI